MNPTAEVPYVCPPRPISPVPVDAFAAGVLFVLFARGVSQIAPTVVAAQSISVIDFMAGPFTLYIEPCKPVSLVLFAVDADLNVAVVVQGSGS